MSFATGLKTIIVATDLLGRPEAALEYGRRIAAAYGARIVLAHGLDPISYAAVSSVPGRVLRELPQQARAELDAMAAELLQQGIHSHSEVRQGAVEQMLADLARQYHAGLIVVGTRGRSGAGPVVVGSVAEELARIAPCPVLAVAEDFNAGEFRPVPGGPVMLSMEINEASNAAIDTATSLAETFHRTLLVVHARAPQQAIAFLNPAATTREEFGIPASCSAPVRCIVRDGLPADVIAEAIAQHRPGILVVGVKRASQTPGAHGTSFSLLSRSRVPVLCVPPDSTAPAVELEPCLTEPAH